MKGWNRITTMKGHTHIYEYMRRTTMTVAYHGAIVSAGIATLNPNTHKLCFFLSLICGCNTLITFYYI